MYSSTVRSDLDEFASGQVIPKFEISFVPPFHIYYLKKIAGL